MAKLTAETGMKIAIYWGVLVVMALFHVWVVSVGLDMPIRSPHSFRQAQTLISVYWMLREGISLNYPMPVFGYPWTVPMEFPLYQWSVVGFVKLSGLPLELSGRLVSLIWFYSGCISLYFLLRSLGFRLLYIVCVFAMVVACPHYLFWSRVPMIESCAWAVGLSWIVFSNKAFVSRKLLWILLMSAFGCLSALVKSTTFLALAPLALALPAHSYWKERGFSADFDKLWACFKIPFLGLVLGIVAGSVWVAYTDAIKEGQVIGNEYTSTNLREWNTGRFADRFDGTRWRNIIVDNSQGFFGIAFGFILVGWFLFSLKQTNSLKWVFIGVFGYLLPAFVFQNLYWVHDYYQYPALIYLVISSGFVLGYLFENNNKIINKVVFSFILILVFFESWSAYDKNYADSLKGPILGYFPIIETVKNLATQDGKIVFYSVDGNPEIAYACERKFILKMPREPFSGDLTKKIVGERENYPIDFLMIPIGDTTVDKPDFINDKIKGFDMVEEPVLIDDNINKLRLYISKKRAKELYEIQLAQFDSVRAALAGYMAKYGEYPKVKPEGACIGHNDWGGETRPDWIPGLVPEFLPHLPREPRGNLFETGKQYYYISDGKTYKFFTMNPAGYYYFKLYRPEMVRESNWKQVIVEG